MYAKVLVPLENSRADQAIVDHVRQLARMHGSRLLLVHVADGWVARYQNQLDLQDSEEMRGDRDYLDRRRAELAAEGFEVETLLEQGEPARRIVQVAEDRGCDLIAMATHGHGIVKDILLGSVAAGVRHRTRVPVLLVRA
jgi:nucleotide-binding universal stress UspA family protein